MVVVMRRGLAWGVPVAAAGAVALSWSGTSGSDSDTPLFVAAGQTLLSTHWSHAFANSIVQAGPLQLALFGSVGRSGVALAVVLALATVLLLLAAAAAAGVRSPVPTSAVGLLGIAAGLTRVGYERGHPADAVLPLVWILAAAYARRGRVAHAGALVGLTAGLETWGILGVAVLALAPRWRDAARGVLIASGIATALFLPFVLGGNFEMGKYQWGVTAPFLSLFVPLYAPFGWHMRLVQGAFAVTAGVGAAWFLRRSPHAPWVVPLAVVSVRLVLDPILLSYYQLAVWGPAIVGAGSIVSVRLLRRSERLRARPETGGSSDTTRATTEPASARL